MWKELVTPDLVSPALGCNSEIYLVTLAFAFSTPFSMIFVACFFNLARFLANFFAGVFAAVLAGAAVVVSVWAVAEGIKSDAERSDNEIARTAVFVRFIISSPIIDRFEGRS